MLELIHWFHLPWQHLPQIEQNLLPIFKDMGKEKYTKMSPVPESAKVNTVLLKEMSHQIFSKKKWKFLDEILKNLGNLFFFKI